MWSKQVLIFKMAPNGTCDEETIHIINTNRVMLLTFSISQKVTHLTIEHSVYYVVLTILLFCAISFEFFKFGNNDACCEYKVTA